MTKENGTWGHSNPTTFHAIFAVNGTTDVLGDELRVVLGIARYHGVGIKPLIGSYNGKLEHSFLVPHSELDLFAQFTEKQESVLVLGPYDARDRRHARLDFADRSEFIGTYGAIPEAHRHQVESWTYDPMQGLYFTARLHWPEHYPHPGMGTETDKRVADALAAVAGLPVHA